MDPTEMDITKVREATRALRGRRVIMADPDELIDTVAAHLIEAAKQRLGSDDHFHLALSGGSTPLNLYRRLVIDPRFRAMPWQQTHLWQVDERCVDHDNELSNFRMLREYLVDHVPIPGSHIHPMPATTPGGEAQYELALRDLLPDGPDDQRLDYILLGMGSDGHTASLFPRSDPLCERDCWIATVDGPTVAPPRPRMTMTFPLINAAREVAILVIGEKKRAAIQHICLADRDVQRMPITGVQPSHDDAELIWYLDHAASPGSGD
ncbi:MAG: 6-phosphogluconolactonase [Planctomycetaceae bacterium]|nr:6-phosphogluconolactonase [Planctomycetaceae bacterium]